MVDCSLTCPIFSIDGPLGVGKTTALRAVEKGLKTLGLKVAAITEDIDTWRNWNGEDVLQRAIEKGDNLFYFQSLVNYTLKKRLDEASHPDNEVDIILVERGQLAQIHVFCQLAKEKGQLTDGEFDLLFKTIIPQYKPVTGAIALWSNEFDFLNQRVRKRDGENANDEWTRQVYNKYNQYFKWFLKRPSAAENMQLVDCMMSVDDVTDHILDFISKCQLSKHNSIS